MLADILLCAAFFTRVPLPDAGSGRSFAPALWAAPLVGAVIGLATGLAILAGLAFGLPPAAAAVAGLAASILMTGALHEDGAADVADGFGGGGTRDDKLAIMRDSRIGSYGTLALVLSVLARWSALAAIAAAEGGTLLWTAIAAHAASRAVLPAFAAYVPPARTTGLSAGIGTLPAHTVGLALGIGFLALLPPGPGFALVATGLLACIFLLIDRLCRRQIGGQTGDVLGAVQQCCEIAILFAATATLV